MRQSQASQAAAIRQPQAMPRAAAAGRREGRGAGGGKRRLQAEYGSRTHQSRQGVKHAGGQGQGERGLGGFTGVSVKGPGQG